MSGKRIPKIALEEAFTIPELTWKSKWYFNADSVEQLNTELLDLHEIRLAKMKELNVEYMFLSLASPGPQDEIDPVKAHSLAKRSNDYLAAEVKKDPSHFGGFASLSMHDPETALREARRAIIELGLQGIILNDFQNIGEDKEDILFYDQPKWDPFWAEIEALGVPLYIHPRLTTPNVRKALLRGREELTGSPFFFGVGGSLLLDSLHVGAIFTPVG
jgi:2,3-dihydroxybenzoate decarboxylase